MGLKSSDLTKRTTMPTPSFPFQFNKYSWHYGSGLRAVKGSINAWAPITHMGDLDETPCSWPWQGPALTTVVTWGTK